MSDWGTLPLPSIIKAKSVDEVLMEATVRNVKSDGINIKVCRISLFEQALCEVVSSILPDRIMEMDIVSKCKMFPLPSITKQMVCESSLQTILIEQAKWKQ